MDAPTDMGAVDIRDQLASERTLLAWIRTGLALMGLGFVVARFGLFLQELQAAHSTPSHDSHGWSQWLGGALIMVGAAMNLFAGWQHVRLVRDLKHDPVQSSRSSTPVIVIAFFLALVGLAMAVGLVIPGGSAHQSNSRQSEENPMASDTANGIVNKSSNHSVDQTVEGLTGILQAKGVKLFALVDHSGEAEKAGLKMRPTKLLIFGSPKAGTPVMQAAPSIAIDLPLKILVWEDDRGKVWLSYNDPAYLQERHRVPQELLQNIAVVESLANQAAR